MKVIPQHDFAGPMRIVIDGKETRIIGTTLRTSKDGTGGHVELGFMDIEGMPPGLNHLRGSEENFIALFRFFLKNIPRVSISMEGDYAHAVETIEGDLYLFLTEAGEEAFISSKDKTWDFIFDGMPKIGGIKLRTDMINPAIVPPCVTTGLVERNKVFEYTKATRVWYYPKCATHGQEQFWKDLKAFGWIKLKSFKLN